MPRGWPPKVANAWLGAVVAARRRRRLTTDVPRALFAECRAPFFASLRAAGSAAGGEDVAPGATTGIRAGEERRPPPPLSTAPPLAWHESPSHVRDPPSPRPRAAGDGASGKRRERSMRSGERSERLRSPSPLRSARRTPGCPHRHLIAAGGTLTRALVPCGSCSLCRSLHLSILFPPFLFVVSLPRLIFRANKATREERACRQRARGQWRS